MSEAATRCGTCGLAASAADVFCEACGTRIAGVASGTVSDRTEIDIATAAGVTDRGLRHSANEDALYVALVEGSVVGVVCDGVSSTVGAGDAAHVAALTAGRVLEEGIRAAAAGAALNAADAIRTAIDAAQASVAALPRPLADQRGAPSCTIAAAIWDGRDVTVGSVGDSRVYWIGADDARRLTRDDSWVQGAVEAGTITERAAAVHPRAHEITGWLGRDAPALDVRVTCHRPDGSGLLVLCTDGLWNYVPTARELAMLVRPNRAASALDLARSLTDTALASGGHDNVTVVVVAVDPPPNGTPEEEQ
jgi:serine/threonine protein phosphatase PrpC